MVKPLPILTFLGAILLVGCGNPITEATNAFSGHINDTIIENSKDPDKLKELHLKTIEKGVYDLKAMGDPNINEVYALINARLSDNELSTYDYNKITTLIHKHKVDIKDKNSNHTEDVKRFKENL